LKTPTIKLGSKGTSTLIPLHTTKNWKKSKQKNKFTWDTISLTSKLGKSISVISSFVSYTIWVSMLCNMYSHWSTSMLRVTYLSMEPRIFAWDQFSIALSKNTMRLLLKLERKGIVCWSAWEFKKYQFSVSKQMLCNILNFNLLLHANQFWRRSMLLWGLLQRYWIKYK